MGIKLRDLLDRLNIKAVTFDDAPYTMEMLKLKKEDEGVAFKLYDKFYILYDPNVNKKCLRFTIAHELGHILLGHVNEYFALKDVKNFGKHKELQANLFAENLLGQTSDQGQVLNLIV